MSNTNQVSNRDNSQLPSEENQPTVSLPESTEHESTQLAHQSDREKFLQDLVWSRALPPTFHPKHGMKLPIMHDGLQICGDRRIQLRFIFSHLFVYP